jgi:hypothetical protein
MTEDVYPTIVITRLDRVIQSLFSPLCLKRG